MNDDKKTTYDNDGFYTSVKVDDQENGILENGELTLNGCYIKTKLEYWQEKEYVKITYSVKNFVSTDKKVSIATHSDIQIGENDHAPVSNMKNNRGFRMTDGNLAIEIFARNTYGVTDVDTYWYGTFPNINAYMWKSGTEASSTYYDLKNVDTGMSITWQNRTIKPGETKEFSFLLGFGEYFNKPELQVYTVPARSYYGSDTIKLAGYMTHTDTPRQGKCIIQLDFANDLIALNNADISGNKLTHWSANYPIPANLKSGSHTISVFGFDNMNQATEAFYYVFTYTPAPTPAPPITPKYTPFRTSMETPNTTPFITPIETMHETPQLTPFETMFATGQETPFTTAHETPYETAFETAFETPYETAFQTAEETPYETAFKTAEETPYETAFQTAEETPFITPKESNNIPIVPITEIPSNNSDPNITNANQDLNENTFRVITTNKWFIIVIVALIIILALIAILALIIFMISKTYKELTSDSEDLSDQDIDIEELSAEDSGETVDISDCDVEPADFFVTTIKE